MTPAQAYYRHPDLRQGYRSRYCRPNGGRLKLTIARYLTPSDRVIDGASPRYSCENPSPEGKYKGDLAPIKGARKLSLNSIGLDVLGAEQRLDTMGYSPGEVDGVFDSALEQAVRKFQSDTGLYSYGVLDITTQQRLVTEYQLYIEENAPDVQLQKAIEALKSNH